MDTTSTLPLNSVLRRSRASAFVVWYSLRPWTSTAAAAWSSVRRRSNGQRLVRLLVEAELERRAGLVPTGVIVVARGPVEAENHVVVWPREFRGVDHAPFQGSVDLGGRGQNRCAARSGVDLAAEAGTDAYLEHPVVADRVDPLPEPSGHLGSWRIGWAGHEVERGVTLLPELEPVALVVPGRHPLCIHAKGDGREPFEGRLLRGPVVCGTHERLDGALRGRIEAVER